MTNETIRAEAEALYPIIGATNNTRAYWELQQKAYIAGRTKSVEGSAGVKRFDQFDIARFWSKVHPTGYCWIWSGSFDADDYGHFKSRGVMYKSHRVAYELIYGEIPESMLVCHTCDNPQCVNPRHLFLGTNIDNIMDKIKKGRVRMQNRMTKYHGITKKVGSNNWTAQLTHKGKRKSLGNFKTEEEAARARDKAVREQGLPLPLNFDELGNPCYDKYRLKSSHPNDYKAAIKKLTEGLEKLLIAHKNELLRDCGGFTQEQVSDLVNLHPAQMAAKQAIEKSKHIV